MTQSVTFIGGPLDLQRITVPDNRFNGGYYRHVGRTDCGFTPTMPVRPSMPVAFPYSDYEIIPYTTRRGGPKQYIGVLMEATP